MLQNNLINKLKKIDKNQFFIIGIISIILYTLLVFTNKIEFLYLVFSIGIISLILLGFDLIARKTMKKNIVLIVIMIIDIRLFVRFLYVSTINDKIVVGLIGSIFLSIGIIIIKIINYKNLRGEKINLNNLLTLISAILLIFTYPTNSKIYKIWQLYSEIFEKKFGNENKNKSKKNIEDKSNYNN